MSSRVLRLAILVLALSGCRAVGDVPSDLAFLEDPGGELTLAEVEERAAELTPRRGENFGYTRSAIWLRFTLSPGERMIEVAHSQLDHVSVYTAGYVHTTGDRLPHASRDMAHRNFVFRPPPSDEPRVVHIRAESEGSLLVPVRVWSPEALAVHTADEQLAFGCYYAFMLALALYNAFLFAATRDRSYGHYVGYLVAFTLFQASLGGHAAMYLWPDAPRWGSLAAIAFVIVATSFGLSFVRGMTSSDARLPKMHRLLAGAAAVLPALILWCAVDYATGVRVATAAVLLAAVSIPVPLAAALFAGSRTARYLVLAYAAILPGAVLLGLRHFELAPVGFGTEVTIKLGTALEALLLSFALVDRINVLTEARRRAERAALEQQQSFSRRLLVAQDAERRRIASELHDGVGQEALVLVTELSRKGSVKEELVTAARRVVRELRAVAHSLHPGQLDRLGLAAALRAGVRRAAEASSLACRVNVAETAGAISGDTALHVYRIVQEGLSNIVRHAHASEVRLEVIRESDALTVSLTDDGCGFDGAAPGLGLASMRERALSIGALLAIESQPGGGTVVRLDVPLRKVSEDET